MYWSPSEVQVNVGIFLHDRSQSIFDQLKLSLHRLTTAKSFKNNRSIYNLKIERSTSIQLTKSIIFHQLTHTPRSQKFTSQPVICAESSSDCVFVVASNLSAAKWL